MAGGSSLFQHRQDSRQTVLCLFLCLCAVPVFSLSPRWRDRADWSGVWFWFWRGFWECVWRVDCRCGEKRPLSEQILWLHNRWVFLCFFFSLAFLLLFFCKFSPKNVISSIFFLFSSWLKLQFWFQLQRYYWLSVRKVFKTSKCVAFVLFVNNSYTVDNQMK